MTPNQEIRLKAKYKAGGKSRYGATSGAAGNKKTKRTLLKGEREASQAATVSNLRVKVLQSSGKVRFVRA